MGLVGTQTLTFTFDSVVNSFGFDINPDGSDLGKTVKYETDSGEFGVFGLPSVNTVSFRGFASATGFTRLTFVKSGESTIPGQAPPVTEFGIDLAVMFGPAAAAPPSDVPEPATLALLGLSLIGLTIRRARS